MAVRQLRLSVDHASGACRGRQCPAQGSPTEDRFPVFFDDFGYSEKVATVLTDGSVRRSMTNLKGDH
ncbi:hypothetical protein RZS08_40770, partial [Arthrospira platensis SPKY1]|nr:hypothetical protein [Arthrospira platensis SPKY1]